MFISTRIYIHWTFDYNLKDKVAKSKFVKGAKRVPLEIVDNTSSSNLVFSLGAWNNIVLPSVEYWSTLKGDESCKVGDANIKVSDVTRERMLVEEM